MSEIEEFDSRKVKEYWEGLRDQRELAKKELIKAIGNLFDNDKVLDKRDYGARGHRSKAGLPGMFYVNYDKNLEPCSSTGTGQSQSDLMVYRWIPLKYEDDEIEFNYSLDLNRDDLDIGTGVVHVNFTKLQMHKIIYTFGNEIGGQNVNKGELNETEDLRGYWVPYRSYLSFPASVRDTKKLGTMLASKKTRKLERNISCDDYPWDHENFSIKPPVMDLSKDNYDAKEVAEFFLELVAYDIRAELEIQQP